MSQQPPQCVPTGENERTGRGVVAEPSLALQSSSPKPTYLLVGGRCATASSDGVPCGEPGPQLKESLFLSTARSPWQGLYSPRECSFKFRSRLLPESVLLGPVLSTFAYVTESSRQRYSKYCYYPYCMGEEIEAHPSSLS